MNGILIGTGSMGVEYCKVLKGLGAEFDVVGRGEENAHKFKEATGKEALTGGIDKWAGSLKDQYTFAIIAVEVEELYHVADLVLDMGVKQILLEKPGSDTIEQLGELHEKAVSRDSRIYIAYNRRFYESVLKAEEMIGEDGGITSVNFEFTEWLGRHNPNHSLENMLLKNSTHVIDLAFYFSGIPTEMSAYHAGWIDYMKNPSIYAGAGVGEKGILFSYQANWEAPGRWSVEVLTRQHRFYFKPMEELWMQEKNSVRVEKVQLPEADDAQYKPGIFKMVRTFLYSPEDTRLLTLERQIKMVEIYNKMK